MTQENLKGLLTKSPRAFWQFGFLVSRIFAREIREIYEKKSLFLCLACFVGYFFGSRADFGYN